MAQLIQIRQRIKAIETIKKITHAMRLVAMSTHTRLKSRESSLSRFQEASRELMTILLQTNSSWIPSSKRLSDNHAPKELVILIGSQKGLCGNFNSSLCYLFEEQYSQTDQSNTEFITVGKRAYEYLTLKRNTLPIHSFNDLSIRTLSPITQHLWKIINRSGYTNVQVVSTLSESFFVQKPTVTSLFDWYDSQHQPASIAHDYYQEDSLDEVMNTLEATIVVGRLEYLIFQSLLAEQAARFVSMDAATRNADNLLDQSKLSYNKLRQALITKELTELTGSF